MNHAAKAEGTPLLKHALKPCIVQRSGTIGLIHLMSALLAAFALVPSVLL